MSSVVRAIVRRGRARDLDAVAELGIEAVEKNAFSNMVISHERIRHNLSVAIANARHYCGVCELDGKVVAAVSALTHDMLCYERQQASVIQFYTRVPGYGLPVMRDFLRWARSRPAIKAIVFTLEVHADPRIARLLQALGFKHEFPLMMEIL